MQRHTEFKVGDEVKVPRHAPVPQTSAPALCSLPAALPLRECTCGCQFVAGGQGVVTEVIDTTGEIEGRVVYVLADETEPFGVPGLSRTVAYAMGELLPVGGEEHDEAAADIALDRWDEEER